MSGQSTSAISAIPNSEEARRLRVLAALETKVRWLSSWTIHNANHLRDSRDGLKVGGHQASSASLVTLMTALYFGVLRPEDRVAVKPHASPVFHAIQYLFGNQSLENLRRFRSFGGAQSYPSRTKDSDDVDFSTGSVGLGAAMTSFASLVRDYLRLKDLAPAERTGGRMVALVGDAELDEGNVYEALLEGWKHDIRNVWWVIDYNRQSLDAVVSDRLFGRFDDLFRNMGWHVVTLKYGKKLRAAFDRPGGDARSAGAVGRWSPQAAGDLLQGEGADGRAGGPRVRHDRMPDDLAGLSPRHRRAAGAHRRASGPRLRGVDRGGGLRRRRGPRSRRHPG